MYITADAVLYIGCLFMRQGITIAILLTASSYLFAQQETLNWFFGKNAGLNFSGGAPLFQAGALSTTEGCSVISDRDGHLLFYTDGTTVWDRDHQPMPNGTGLLGGGTGSSSQSSLIVPHPGNDSLYYVFTVDESNNISTNAGFRYSIVNIRRNGGKGDIVQKNTLLLYAYENEMIAGIRHSNGKDIWVLTHQASSNNFYEFRITAAGLNPQPAIITCGEKYYKYIDHGYLRFSPDGKKLAAAYSGTHTEVYDFDAATGNISNATVIADYMSDGYCSCYGLEFSCDSRLLYVSEVRSCSTGFGSNLVQYDLTQGSPAAITASRVILEASATLNQAGALQLAPDGKIYIAFSEAPYLGAITRPGVVGTGCNFVREYFPLPTPALSEHGLPNFVQSYFNTNPDLTVTNNCTSTSISFDINAGIVDSVRWDFGDIAAGTLNTATGQHVIHQYSIAGEYLANAVIYGPCRTDTIRRKIYAGGYAGILGPDTIMCEGSALVLKPGIKDVNYTWQDGSVLDSFIVKKAGSYAVKISNASCTWNDTINVQYITRPDGFIGNDTVVCNNAFPVSIGRSLQGAGFQWNTGANTAVITVQQPGIYWRTTRVGACAAIDSIQVLSKAVTPIDLGRDTSFCQSPVIQLSAHNNSLQYLWSNGSSSPQIEVALPGLYWCNATSANGCVFRDSIVVDPGPLPAAIFASESFLCVNDSLSLNAAIASGESYLWQDGSTSPEIMVRKPGNYAVIVTKQGCSRTYGTHISGKRPPEINLGPDFALCKGQTKQLYSGLTTDVSWQDGSNAGSFLVTGPGLYFASATNSCGTGRDSVLVSMGSCALIFPSAFSPNKDGRNDLFKPVYNSVVAGYSLIIFNRWGQKIFESRDPSIGWDGSVGARLQQPGTFVWMASYRDASGKLSSINGSVLLVR